MVYHLEGRDDKLGGLWEIVIYVFFMGCKEVTQKL